MDRDELLEIINQCVEFGSISLDLGGKQIASLPTEIGKLTTLQVLDISHNEFTELPQEIGKLTNLMELNLRGNRLTGLPPEIGNLSNLQTFDLSANQLSSLPPEITNLTSLHTLYLWHNRLTDLPTELWKLTNLRRLGISGNQFTELPQVLWKLTNLQVLRLSENNFTELPPELLKLTNLLELNLWNNRLTILPQEIGNFLNLQRLYLSDNRLTELPPEIGKLTNLMELNLRGNRLTGLPPEIGNLTNLQTLNLLGNQISGLPTEIGKLTNLEELNLEGNRLTVLPREIGNLGKLQTLHLSDNQLTELPSEIWTLTKLHKLGLWNNRLTVLPAEIGNLKNLKALYLRNNRLTVLPPKIGNLTNLEELSLMDNRLIKLPSEIVKLKSLRTLSLEGNPLTLLPPGIVSEGMAVLSYLRKLREAGTERYEAKLLILGDGGVGKTCLSRALRGLTFEATPPSTQGVDIDPWEFPHPKDPDNPGKNVTLNIWDFEGQEINYPTHQFFYTQRSLYIVVFNGRREFRYDRIEYWLETIRARAPQSMVLIVATECDKSNPTINLEQLKAEYGDLLINKDDFYFEVECKKGDGIEKLINQLKNCVSDETILPLMGKSWPQSYANAEIAIGETSKSRSHITRSELQDIFRQSGIPEEDYTLVSSVMGDMGIITHFPNFGSIDDFIVLKPHWLTKAISLVMEDKELEGKQGECDLKWLEKKWVAYPGLTKKFHSVMKAFELCYDLDSPDPVDAAVSLVDSRLLTLVPMRFGYKKPEIIWSNIEKAQQRRIQYRFDTTPPVSIMSRFIVKTHHMILITPTRPTGVYWFNGVFLKTGEGPMRSEALCEFNIKENKFDILVKAAFPQNMLVLLNDVAQSVFKFFPGAKLKLYYGCVENDEQCTGYHEEEKIMYTMSSGLSNGFGNGTKIPCAGGLHDINAFDFVNGFSSFAESVSAKADVKQSLRKEINKTPELSRDISRDAGSVILRVDALSKKLFSVGRDISKIPAIDRQKFQLAHRDYLNLLFNETKDSIALSYIPSLIAIERVKVSFTKVTGRLTPYCESEEGIHPADFNFEFEETADWWKIIAPNAGSLLQLGLLAAAGLFSISHPTVAPGISILVPAIRGLSKLFINKTKKAEAENTVVVFDDEELDISFDNKRFKRGLDECRRTQIQIAEVIKRYDKGNYDAKHWGELERLRMIDNTYRWLCKRHADEYRNRF